LILVGFKNTSRLSLSKSFAFPYALVERNYSADGDEKFAMLNP